MIDLELVQRKMALIAGDLEPARELAGKPLAAYLENPTSEVLAERYLERMIGRMIDVNYHLLTASGRPPPRDYYQSFVELGSQGVLPTALAQSLAPAAGLRNRLVHEYDEIDPTRVHEALRKAIEEIPAYLDGVRRFLDSAPE